MMRLVTGLGLGLAALGVGAQTFVVPAELWDRPRSARVILDQPDVREAVKAHLSRPGSYLIVRHAQGREPAVRAEELRAWLMALAVEPERVVLHRDPALADALRLDVREDADR
jgi:hypothetical protein